MFVPRLSIVGTRAVLAVEVPPQQCFLDHFESWSTNEITINWNAALTWMAFWLADH